MRTLRSGRQGPRREGRDPTGDAAESNRTILIGVLERWTALTHISELWMTIVLATLGGTAGDDRPRGTVR